MTIKLKIAPRASIIARVSPRLGASVAAGSGIAVNLSGGIYTVAVDPDGSTLTTLGTVTIGTWNADAIAAQYGGTGQTSYTTGDMLYASGSTALSRLAAGTSGYAIMSNGASVAPSYQGFTQSGTGATTRTWLAKAREIVSVEDFGAVGDGTMNDYAAIQAACDSVSAGAEVHLGNKSYLSNSTISPPQGVTLVGHFHGTTILNGQTNAPAVKIGNGTDQWFGGGCRNITFASANGVVGVSGQAGLLVTKVGQFEIDGCRVVSIPAALYDGIQLTNASQFYYHRNEVQNCLGNGVEIIDCSDMYGTSCRSDANAGSGFVFAGCSGVYLSDFSAFANATVAWYLAKLADHEDNHHFLLKACIGDSSGGSNWKITALTTSTLLACWGSTQNSGAITTAEGFYFAGDRCQNLFLFGCHAHFNNGDGIKIYDVGGGAGGDGETGAPTNIHLFGCHLGSTDDEEIGVQHGNGQEGVGYGLNVTGASVVMVHGGSMLDNATGTYFAHGSSTVRVRDVFNGSTLVNGGDAVADLSAVSALGSGVATFLGTPSSANLRSALTDETGTGAAVFANTPTLVTPVLGAATATTINGVTLDNNAWSTYSPSTTTGQSTGTVVATTTGRYKQIGKTVFVYIRIQISGTFTGGTISSVSLPVATANTTMVLPLLGFESAGTFWAASYFGNSTTAAQMKSTNGNNTVLDTNDINFSGVYEAT